MRGWKLFLAYYTLTISLVLFAWSIFFTQKPEGFLLTAIIVPTGFYFWLLVAGVGRSHPSDPHSESQTRNKYAIYPLIILMTLFISSFSIFAYSQMVNRPFNSQSSSAPISKQIDSLKLELTKQNKSLREETLKEFEKIKKQLLNLKTAQKVTENAEILGGSTALVGTITIKDLNNQTITVYAEKSVSSKIVGKAEFGKNYTFLEKDPDWYLILLDEKEGFVKNQFFKEVQYEK